MPYSIAIDGPAGAGKSTVAKAVAAELGYIYVDTGAMYRAVALDLLRNGVPLDKEAAVAEAVSRTEVSIRYDASGTQQVYLNGENVSGLIRTEEVGGAASAVSQYVPVREKLVALQQQLAAEESVVMDGRDIGTKVLPYANLKIFLTASVSVRAERRWLELKEKGIQAVLSEIEKDIAERDERDMKRKHSPLVKAEDAVLLDSSDLTADEVIDRILALADGVNR